jgi:N-acetylglutamate synthase-like GNAT family acetyltransferase
VIVLPGSVPELRAAEFAEYDGVVRLLDACGLPSLGLADQWPASYVVAVQGEELVGVAGLERYQDAGLLRSVAVRSDLRGSGLGGRLVEDRLRWAREHQIRLVCLLTTSAATWFPRYGFTPVTREQLPAALLAAPEFAFHCCDSAAVLATRTA